MGVKSNKYFVKNDYALLIKNPSSPLPSKIWGKYLNVDGLPKNNIFCWELVHEKILMEENLQKRKISGPSRCVLSGNSVETIKHLFFQYPFIVDT